MMKKILMGLGVLIVLFILFIWWGSTVETPASVPTSTTTADTTPLTNQNFTSDKGNFSIYFEGAPQYKPGNLTLKNGETYPTHLYQYESADGGVWQALYTEYPASVDVSNPENMLLNTVKGTEGSLNGKITSTKIGTHQGFPAIDYIIEIPDQSYNLKGRNILNGHKFYSVSMIYDNTQDPAIDKFFDSLIIKK